MLRHFFSVTCLLVIFGCSTAIWEMLIIYYTENRMVAEISSERRLKSQKIKSKTSEGRKHLSSVRVIQRNLAYVIGLPANLADEAVSTFSMMSTRVHTVEMFLALTSIKLSSHWIFMDLSRFLSERNISASMGRF